MEAFRHDASPLYAPVQPGAGTGPFLVVIIDAEEEFDWNEPLARENVGVESILAQGLAQRIFERFGVKPAYLVDYPVAEADRSSGFLRELLDDGTCEIGAQLHPWVNPPFDEELVERNSYPGNLPAALEREKLARLTDLVAWRFGRPPTIYKAGRYGLGPATFQLIEDLGYLVDTSVVPYTSFMAGAGPDFTRCPGGAFWFGTRRPLLEIPISRGFAGPFSTAGHAVWPRLEQPLARRLRIAGILSRARLLERLTLSPEGDEHAAHRRLTEAMLARGRRIFSFSYHSSSLGCHTPYVRNERERAVFLETIERYLAYFLNEIGGTAITPTQLYEMLSPPSERRGLKLPTLPASALR